MALDDRHRVDPYHYKLTQKTAKTLITRQRRFCKNCGKVTLFKKVWFPRRWVCKECKEELGDKA